MSKNPLTYRVCGTCSMDYPNQPITGTFANTFFKCKLCNQPNRDGCYMLFSHNAEEHFVNKPVMFIGDRQEGKTTWLLNKINEYESITGPRFYVIHGHGQKALADFGQKLAFEHGFTRDQHFKLVNPLQNSTTRFISPWIEHLLVAIDPESNVYVDEIQQLNHHDITDLSMAVASGRIRQLFCTKQISPLDVLTNHSHIYTASQDSGISEN